MALRKVTRIKRLRIIETSAVDRPANDLALVEHMEIAKRLEDDLTPEEKGVFRKLYERVVGKADAAATQPVKKADEKPAGDYGDVKYADPGYQDDKKPRYPLDNEQHIRAAWGYIAHEKNRKKYSADQVKAIEKKIVAAWKAKIDKDGPPSADEQKKYLEKLLQERRDEIRKDLMAVSWLADIVQRVDSIARDAENENEWEGDDSDIPKKLAAARDELGAILVEMCSEETAELRGEEATKLALSEDTKAIIESIRKIAPAPAAAAAPAAEPAKPVAAAQPTELAKANASELKEMAQGAHDALAAAGAPPHVESEGGDDIDEGKLDKFEKTLSAAEATMDTETYAMLKGLIAKAKFGKKVGENLEKAHGFMKKMGADCGVDKAAAAPTGEAAVAKIFATELGKRDDALGKLGDALAKLTDKIDKIGAQPQPMPAGLQTRVFAVDKGGSVSPFKPAGGDSPEVTKKASEPVVPSSDPESIMPGISKVNKNGVGDLNDFFK